MLHVYSCIADILSLWPLWRSERYVEASAAPQEYKRVPQVPDALPYGEASESEVQETQIRDLQAHKR